MNDPWGSSETEAIGEFEVTGGSIMATDPCYNRGTWCQKMVPAKNGRWLALAETRDFGPGWLGGKRTTALRVYHEDYGGPPPCSSLDGSFGVDSGQFGFYDGARYPEGETGDYSDKGSFYGRVCAVHDGEGGMCEEYIPNGMVAEGPVASSGFGDGSYDVLVQWEDGVAVALEAIFISDEEDELDELDDDEEDDLEEEDEQEPAGATL